MHIGLAFPRSTFLEAPMTMPPLGLWYLASQLEAQGHTTDFRALDADAFFEDGECDQVWLSATSPQMYEVRRLSDLVSGWTRSKTVFGGAAPWARPKTALELNFDLIVSGEADHPNTVRQIVDLAGSCDKRTLLEPAITPGPIDWALPPVRRWDDRYHFSLTGRDNVSQRATTMFGSRGCPMACAFCLEENQRVLMADWTWRAIKDVRVGEQVMAYYDARDRQSAQGAIAPTTVRAVLDNGIRQTITVKAGERSLQCTPDHKIYADDGHKTRWKLAKNLRPGIAAVRMFYPQVNEDPDFRRGWCAGYITGDGCVHRRMKQLNLTVASRDIPLLDRLQEWAAELGYVLRRFKHIMGPGIFPTKLDPIAIDALQCTSGPQTTAFMAKITPQDYEGDSYKRGWLAGMYDADGYLETGGPACRILQSPTANPHKCARIEKYLQELGIYYSLSHNTTGLNSYNVNASLFLRECRPALQRKYLAEHGYKSLDRQTVSAVEPSGDAHVYDLTTDAHSFITEGFIVHNCESGRNGVIWDRAVRYEPISLIEAQLREIAERGHGAVQFYDDILPLNKPRTREIMNRLKRFGFIWRCFIRTDVIAKQGGFDYLRQMADAGLVEVLAGVESADNRIKDGIHKGTTIEQDTQALHWCKQLGIKFKASFILGLPGEDADSLARTREWILRERPDRADVNALIPMPGTPITRSHDYLGNEYDVAWDEELPEQWFYKGAKRSASVLVSTSHLSSGQIAAFREQLIAEMDAQNIPY